MASIDPRWDQWKDAIFRALVPIMDSLDEAGSSDEFNRREGTIRVNLLAALGTLLTQIIGAEAVQVSRNTNARADELKDQATRNFDGLSSQIAEISGGVSGSDALNTEVRGVAERIRQLGAEGESTFGRNLVAIVSALQAISNNTGQNIAPALGPLVTAVQNVQAQLAQLGVTGGDGTVTGDVNKIRTALEGLVDLRDDLGKALFTIGPDADQELTLAGVPNLGRLAKAIGTVFTSLGAGAYVANDLTAGRLAEVLTQRLPFLAQVIPELATELGQRIVRGIEIGHAPARAFMGALATLFFEQVDGELAGLGESHPDTVLPMARQLLTLAASLGATAHLVSAGAERVAGGKNLGLGFVAAFLSDLAGFQNIAQHSFVVQYETALRGPAQRRANARFRPALPPAALVEQMWHEQRISDDDLRRFYAEQGWSDVWIENQLAVLPREASPRDLALVFEDGDLDLEWATRHLKESGFNAEDAARIAAGVRTRALRTARSSAVTAILNAYENGIIDADGVTERLRPLRLSDEAIELYLLASDMDRFRLERTQLRTELLSQAGAGVAAPEDVQASLAAFGFDERAQLHTAALARLRANRRVLTEEQADVRAATRRAQSTAITAAQEGFRRGLLDQAGLAAALRASGVTEAEVDNLVELARVRLFPVPRLAEVLTPEAQAQRLLDLEADRVITLVRRGVIDAATGLSSLVGLGVPPAEAERRVNLAAAQAARPPDRFVPRTINEVVEEARRVKMATAREEFRAGLLDVNGLGAALRDAGVEPAVVQAVVDFETTRQRTEAERRRQTEGDRAILAARREQQQAAVEAFHAGQLDDAGLLANLLSIGVDDALARAIVEGEALRRDVDQENAAATAEERERAAEQRLREEAVVFGIRSGLIDVDQARQLLLDAGVSETRVELVIARELARPRPAPA